MKLVYLFIALLFPLEEAGNTTVITIDNLDIALGGNVKVQVYDEDMLHEENANPILEKTVQVSESCLPLKLDHLPEGKYMVAVFHDTNANGKLDYSFFGVPKEGYGFSGKFSCGLKSAGPSLHYVQLTNGLNHIQMHLCY
ncbi:DUF2141 domain-containing protein [Echinicola sp. 20G]|uniref:DUF2141 domain-containing protein n=1 Tax=Echinicola sp. 20G TaxID=2781961 RepID=UPI0019102BE0|nr:DUF2141 domain-containing protein [Echinicola sp. 20G]